MPNATAASWASRPHHPKEPGLEPDDVLGKPLAVGIKPVIGEDRFCHGIVTDFAKTGTTHLQTRYTAEVRPMPSMFDRTFDCRIFNDLSQDALAIVTGVFAQRGLTDIESGAIRDHAKVAHQPGACGIRGPGAGVHGGGQS